ncbi:hypothetical protein ACFDTO_35605 [Microbacteriaceae bacterium 4G12]
MKEKFLVMFSMVAAFFIFLVTNVSASSSFVISKEKAGGYQFTVIKEQDNFIWKIGHQDNLSTIQENKDNTEDLDYFRTTVKNINTKIFEIIVSASYFLIVVVTALILYKKNKQMFKSGGAFIAILAVIALYITFTNSIELNTTFQDAKFYYSRLTK